VEESGHVRVVLDLQIEGEPITGRISLGAESERPFHGWLELANAIESARGRATALDPGTLSPDPEPVPGSPGTLAPDPPVGPRRLCM
jgi:hypothetical protein